MASNESFMVGQLTHCSLCGGKLKDYENEICVKCLQEIKNAERLYGDWAD
jgi:predicted amidophosphoribosyltransferase